MPKTLWNPAGFWPSAISGGLFGIVMSVVVSLFSGTWWWLLTSIPMAFAWALLWRHYYPRVYERVRTGLERPKE